MGRLWIRNFANMRPPKAGAL